MLVKRQPEPAVTGCTKIWLSPRVSVIVDRDDYEKLSRYRWRLRHSSHCFYAVRRIRRNGKTYEVKMHRIIAKTPPGYDCHHINHNTLDNRKVNLQNLLPDDHAALHSIKQRGGGVIIHPKST